MNLYFAAWKVSVRHLEFDAPEFSELVPLDVLLKVTRVVMKGEVCLHIRLGQDSSNELGLSAFFSF